MKRASGPVLALATFLVLSNGTSANAVQLLVASHGNNRVLRYAWPSGRFIDVSGSGGGELGSQGMTLGPDGNLYVGGEYSHNVGRYDGQTGEFIDAFATTHLNGPTGLTFGPDGSLYVSCWNCQTVAKFNGKTGDWISDFALLTLFSYPHALAFGPDGNLYVNSYAHNQVLRYDGVTGQFLGVFASHAALMGATGLVFAPDGNLYVASRYTNLVLQFDGQTGDFIDALGGGPLNEPYYLTFKP